MTERYHFGTLLWGLALTAWGATLLGEGLGWWDLELGDLRYAGPILIILIGVLVLVGALRSGRGSSRQT